MLLEASEKWVRFLIEKGKRIDERTFDQFRQITIEKGVSGNAEGSAKVKLGDTEVIVGVKMSVGTPFEDSPEEGILIVGAEFSPLSSSLFEPGPPDENSIELARVVDRGIRESKCIELSKLCIEPKEKVWIINVDIQIINHDGNLLDASSIGAIAALLNTKIPKYDGEKIIFGEYEGTLPVIDKPVGITVYKIGNHLLLDTKSEEEPAIDARLTVVTNSEGRICAMQKGGEGSFTQEEIEKCIETASRKAEEIRNLL